MDNPKGYGLFECADRKIRPAHRCSWMMAHGAEIPGGAMILHQCDNPPCVRPDHLFVGNNQDNMIDMMQKRRQTYALTREQVEDVRARCVVTQGRVRRRFIGESVASLATEYGVTRATIERILRRDTWYWPDEVPYAV